MGVANEDVTVGRLMEYVCTNLPVGWEIEFWMREGSSGVELNHKESGYKSELRQGSRTVADMMIDAVTHARRVACLKFVPFSSQKESFP